MGRTIAPSAHPSKQIVQIRSNPVAARTNVSWRVSSASNEVRMLQGLPSKHQITQHIVSKGESNARITYLHYTCTGL